MVDIAALDRLHQPFQFGQRGVALLAGLRERQLVPLHKSERAVHQLLRFRPLVIHDLGILPGHPERVLCVCLQSLRQRPGELPCGVQRVLDLGDDVFTRGGDLR